MNRNLILIGMPGCGKSTCGVLAAKALCKSFIDTYLLIQQREGCSLQEILNIRGSEYFSQTEAHVLQNLEAENSIVSTGGSAIYYEDAMMHLKENVNRDLSPDQHWRDALPVPEYHHPGNSHARR